MWSLGFGTGGLKPWTEPSGILYLFGGLRTLSLPCRGVKNRIGVIASEFYWPSAKGVDFQALYGDVLPS